MNINPCVVKDIPNGTLCLGCRFVRQAEGAMPKCLLFREYLTPLFIAPHKNWRCIEAGRRAPVPEMNDD